MTTMKERYQAILFGCAAGDTLGMPLEGWKQEQIKTKLLSSWNSTGCLKN